MWGDSRRPAGHERARVGLVRPGGTVLWETPGAARTPEARFTAPATSGTIGSAQVRPNIGLIRPAGSEVLGSTKTRPSVGIVRPGGGVLWTGSTSMRAPLGRTLPVAASRARTGEPFLQTRPPPPPSVPGTGRREQFRNRLHVLPSIRPPSTTLPSLTAAAAPRGAAGRFLHPGHTSPLIDMKARRTSLPSLQAQVDAANRTRGAARGPQPDYVYEARSADLEADGADTELHANAISTDAKKDTALRWWARFVLYIGLHVHLLSFDSGSSEARLFVTSLVRQFLCFVYRTGGNSGGDGPISPDSVHRYWTHVREFHLRLNIDISFANST